MLSQFQNISFSSLCNRLIQFAESTNSFKQARFGKTVALEIRKNKDLKVDLTNVDQDIKLIVNDVITRIQEQIPQNYLDKKFKCLDPNHIYILKYDESDFFKAHRDGFSQDAQGNQSLVTVQMYQHDSVPAAFHNSSNFVGGATRFYDDSLQHLDVYPRAGNAIAFDHRWLHEGMIIEKGIKYTIRFNAIYA
jgi:hypothetical protein